MIQNYVEGQWQLSKEVQVPESELQQYYTDQKAEYEQVHARHILIRFQGTQVAVKPGAKDLTEAEALAKAQEIRQKIASGQDFAELAKAESDDTGSGANGGELGSFRHGQMVPSFEEAAFALKVGEVSQPVKSQFGYHIIQVLSHDSKSFEDVKADLEAKIKPLQTQKSVDKAIDDLQKSHPPVLDPEFFGQPDKSPDKSADKK